jgi:hypothetical protein
MPYKARFAYNNERSYVCSQLPAINIILYPKSDNKLYDPFVPILE